MLPVYFPRGNSASFVCGAAVFSWPNQLQVTSTRSGTRGRRSTSSSRRSHVAPSNDLVSPLAPKTSRRHYVSIILGSPPFFAPPNPAICGREEKTVCDGQTVHFFAVLYFIFLRREIEFGGGGMEGGLGVFVTVLQRRSYAHARVCRVSLRVFRPPEGAKKAGALTVERVHRCRFSGYCNVQPFSEASMLKRKVFAWECCADLDRRLSEVETGILAGLCARCPWSRVGIIARAHELRMGTLPHSSRYTCRGRGCLARVIMYLRGCCVTYRAGEQCSRADIYPAFVLFRGTSSLYIWIGSQHLTFLAVKYLFLSSSRILLW